MAGKTLDDSLRLATTSTDIDNEWYVREASTTGMTLIEICSKLLLAIV